MTYHLLECKNCLNQFWWSCKPAPAWTEPPTVCDVCGQSHFRALTVRSDEPVALDPREGGPLFL